MTSRAELNAYDCRIKNKIVDLPLTLSGITRLVEQIGGKVSTYLQSEEELQKRGLYHIAADNPNGGFCVVGKSGNRPIIYLSDQLDDNARTYVIAHELGHYFCGHLAVLPLGMSEEADDAQEIEANEFARCLLAPPYVLYKMRCVSPKAIQSKALIDYNNAHKVSDLIDNVDTSSPTDQEIQLWRMMSGKRRYILPASVGGVAALAIIGVIVWSVAGNTPDTPVIGSPSSAPSDAPSSVVSTVASDVHSAPSVPSVASQGASSTASVNHTVTPSKPAVASKPVQSSSAPVAVSSAPDNRPTKAEVTAAYNARKQTIQVQISDIDTQIATKNKLLTTAQTDRDNLKKSYDQLSIAGSADHILADIQSQIEGKDKEITNLTAEIEQLQADKTKLTQELSRLTDQYMVDLQNAK